MRCQEVMEFMQRYLDQDLNDMENKWLTDHMRQCPACAAMFERLKHLSCELEQLPKVVPPFSIVDSILPRLEQIELLQTENEQAAKLNSAVATAGPAAASDSNKASAWFRRLKEQISLKAVGGVVAAGIVLGMLIVTYKPFPSFDSADAENSMLKHEKGSMEKSGAADEGNSDNESLKPMSADDAQSNSVDDNSAKAKSHDADNQMDSEKAYDISKESANVESHQDEVREPAVEKHVPPSNGSKPDQQADQSTQNTEKPDDEVAVPGLDLEDEDSSNHFLGIGKAPQEPQQATSKDGAYTAFVEHIHDHLRVVVVNKDQMPLFISSDKNADQIVNLHWSEDGRFVEYDTRIGDELHHYTIDMEQGIESAD